MRGFKKVKPTDDARIKFQRCFDSLPQTLAEEAPSKIVAYLPTPEIVPELLT